MALARDLDRLGLLTALTPFRFQVDLRPRRNRHGLAKTIFKDHVEKYIRPSASLDQKTVV